MRVHAVQPPHKRQQRKRIGRGNASGNGTYAGKGLKGQKARSGGGVRRGFEGGQLPMMKALPTMRGFSNSVFRIQHHIVNVAQLSVFSPDAQVTPTELAQRGLIRDTRYPVKILGNGSVNHALTVEAHMFSVSARQKIEAAGGIVKEL